MDKNKQDPTREERLDKAKALMAELKKLELSDDELKEIIGGCVTNIKTPGVY